MKLRRIFQILVLVYISHLGSNAYKEGCSSCSWNPLPDTWNKVRYDCSNCRLEEVPKFPISAEKIQLSFNMITTIRNTSFLGMSNLKELYLDNNKLSVIEKHSLSSLKSLRILVLCNNRLNATHLESLEFVVNIQFLDIRFNDYIKYPDSLANLSNLDTLKIDIFRGFTFDNRFIFLTKLRDFILEPRTKQISLQNNTFDGLRNSPITNLLIELRRKVERPIGIDFLQPFRCLKWLKLDIGGDFDILDIMKILHGLRNRKLDYIDISRNAWDIYRYHHLTNHDIDNLLTICVSEINLSSNNIYYFPFLESLNTNFTNCLEKLIFSSNMLFWTVPEVIGLFYLPSLRYLDLSVLSPCTGNKYSENHMIENLNMNVNITTHTLKKLEYVDLSGLQMTSHPYGRMHCTIHFDLPKLKTLKAGNTGLDICSMGVYVLKSLEYLDMVGWRCGNLNPNFLQRHRELIVLNASNSAIAVYSSRSESMLRELTKLEIIVLSHNNIYQLSPEFFDDQALSLKHLDLSSNNLNNIPTAFMSLRAVKNIILKYNNFAYFGTKDRQIIDMLRNTTFDFEGNVFECSCKYVDSLVWLNGTNNIKNLYCKDGKEMSYVLRNIHFFQLHCVSELWFNASLIAVLLVMITLLVSVVGYRNKSFVIYLYIKARRLVKQKNRETQRNEYKYDAFVSYSHFDYDWVTGSLFRFLSDELSLHVCLHQKDFIPGEPIAEEILRCVESSRKSVFVITRHFLTSKWSMLEMDIARHHVFHGDSDTILVILKDDIPVHEMPLSLRKIWWRIVCLKYPQNDDTFERQIFENKLSAVFKEK